MVNESPVKPRRHTFVLLALAIGVIIGLAGGAGLISWLGPKPAPNPPLIRPLTFSGKDSSPSVSPDGRTIAFVSQRDGRSRIWVKQLATGSEIPLTEGPDSFPRISPDGNWILFTRAEKAGGSSLYKVALVGGEPQPMVRNAWGGDWSPDGRKIAHIRLGAESGSSAILTADSNGTGEKQIVQIPNLVIWGLRWSPDGQTLTVLGSANSTASYTTLLVNLETGKWDPFENHPAGSGPLLSNWAAGGQELVWALSESYPIAGSSTTRVLSRNRKGGPSRTLFGTQQLTDIVEILDGGKVIFDSWSRSQNLQEWTLAANGKFAAGPWLTRGATASRQPRFSQDGSILFSSMQSGNLDLWRVSRTGELRPLTPDPAQDWDPDISRVYGLVWSSNRSGHFEIWIAEADGRNPRQVSQDGIDAENPVLAPDGNWIVYASGNPQKPGVWKIRRDGSDSKRIAAQGGHPEVSPDGLNVLFDVAD